MKLTGETLKMFIDELEQGEIVKIKCDDRTITLFVFGKINDTVFVYNEYTEKTLDIYKVFCDVNDKVKGYDVQLFSLRNKDNLQHVLEYYYDLVGEGSFKFDFYYRCAEAEEECLDLNNYQDDLKEYLIGLIEDNMEKHSIMAPYIVISRMEGGKMIIELKQ